MHYQADDVNSLVQHIMYRRPGGGQIVELRVADDADEVSDNIAAGFWVNAPVMHLYGNLF